MPLKDRIKEDNARVFINLDEFATEHSWDGKKIRCVIDGNENTRQNRINVLENSWETNRDEIYLHVPAEELGYLPTARSNVYFDRQDMQVIKVEDNMGIYSILLRAHMARDMD